MEVLATELSTYINQCSIVQKRINFKSNDDNRITSEIIGIPNSQIFRSPLCVTSSVLVTLIVSISSKQWDQLTSCFQRVLIETITGEGAVLSNSSANIRLA
jgi:hypothetical protein